jgi:hypothetical protein
MIRYFAVTAALLHANAANAALPAVVEAGWKQLALSVVSFFVMLIASSIAGLAVARRVAPESRHMRQFVFSAFSFAGLVAGAFIAVKVVPAWSAR